MSRARGIPRSLVGATMMSVRSHSGRKWRVVRFNAINGYGLMPLGDDVRPAKDSHGHMQGGVRWIWVSYERLHDPKYWTLLSS